MYTCTARNSVGGSFTSTCADTSPRCYSSSSCTPTWRAPPHLLGRRSGCAPFCWKMSSQTQRRPQTRTTPRALSPSRACRIFGTGVNRWSSVRSISRLLRSRRCFSTTIYWWERYKSCRCEPPVPVPLLARPLARHQPHHISRVSSCVPGCLPVAG
jgi:hypothetical protein